ncbi:outer membrane protein assembly factor BamB family protein [Pontibacter lucknowensis]|uniref:Por secretion system C-terminal sorting domain-containing protein n=1 Tax=Pontibacter lucknowensis TaxID=1077936 RepID=A0A1N7ATY7_9BACT|nr:PQQ-binding-like beta-propeller repeat protein [Pontibacter lucknowensis]SIR42535.1 Por secretion system C-terminal sorting domain-containing protein [Pontibacter lucknowensis]
MSDFTRLPNRDYGFLLVVSLFLSLLVQPVLAQQVTEAWERRYGSDFPTFESGAFSAVDAAGNTYVAGNSRSSTLGSPTNYDAFVAAKFSPTGEVLWQHHFPLFQYPHALVDVALDETGFYVAASTVDMGSRTTVYVVNYNVADGQVVWQQSETPFSNMTGIELLADNRGGLIMVGSGHFNMPGDFTQLFKYNAANGERIWIQSVSGTEPPNVYQHVAGIALDSQGDIYLTGSTGILDNASQMLTTKRSRADGSLVWQVQYDSNLQNRAMQIAVDETGGVYTWGVLYATDPDQPEGSFLIRYDAANGNQVWQEPLQSAGIPGQLVADEAGGLYMVSNVQGGTQLARYGAADGSLHWSSLQQGSFAALDTDEAGHAYLGVTLSDAAFAVGRYSATNGEQVWEYASQEDSTYVLDGVKVSEAGTLHLTGTSGGVDSHLFVASLQTATGALVFNTTFIHTLPGIDQPANMVTDNDGNVYVTATSGNPDASRPYQHAFLLKYSPDGELLWNRQFYNSDVRQSKHLAVDAAGAVYMMLSVYGSDARPQIRQLKLSGATGGTIWEQEHGPTDANLGREIQLDQLGNLYIMGTVSPQFDLPQEDFLIKVDTETGQELWTKRYGRQDSDSDLNELVAFALDETGDVYVTGTARAPAVVNNLALAKYAGGDGSVLWNEIYNSSNRQTEHQVTGIAVDTTSGVYLAALDILDTGEHVAYLLKFEAASGAFVWRQPTIDEVTNSGSLSNLILDNAGGAYVTSFNNRLIKLSTEEPGVIWTTPFQGAISAVELDEAGGIYVAYSTTDGVQIVKYKTSDGSRVWDVFKEGQANHMQQLLALDKDRNVFVVNTTYSPDTNFDLLTVKYSQTTEEPSCAIPVNVQLYLAPYAIRAGWEARTTADFSPYILTEDTGLRWTWGDGSEPTMSYTAFGTSRITGKHIYTQAGIYQVGLDFSESCLEATNSDYNQWHVIYDPEAGHVQGSGSIVLANFGLGGNSQKLEAEFSFYVRYQNKHATRPQGTLQLTVNKQEFSQSGALDWLVITGDQAIWKGTAQLQGVGRFGYIVSVRDAGGKGKNDPNDQLRIRIWDLSRGNAVVFDNFESGGDIYDLSSETGPRIGWGNIVINGRKDNRDLHAANGEGMQRLASTELLAYPNPADALTTIRFTSAVESAYELQLFDMKGALMQQVRQGQAKAGEVTEVQLDVSSLKKGMYLARITSAGGVQTVKIVVER